jgi:hypothetical protein
VRGGEPDVRGGVHYDFSILGKNSQTDGFRSRKLANQRQRL